MSTLPINFKLTNAGIAAAFALGTSINLNVNYVQLGSGNKSPDGTETSLLSPQEYTSVGSFYTVGTNQHRIGCIVLGSASTYNISEIGLWSGIPGNAGSVLVFYWSLPASVVPDFAAVKSTSVDFNLETDLYFGGIVPSNITVVVDTSSSLSILSSFTANNNTFQIGDLKAFAGNTPPSSWMACPTAVSLQSTTGAYAALFSVIGYAWGGSGANFSLPWVPLGGTLRNGGTVGASDNGQTINHVHAPSAGSFMTAGTGGLYSGSGANSSVSYTGLPLDPTTHAASGGSSNIPAGSNALWCFKYQ